MLFALPRQTDHLISDASDNAFVVACKFPESDLSILSDQVLPNRTSGCRVMSQAQVLCEKDGGKCVSARNCLNCLG
jgi:hypothetical protein